MSTKAERDDRFRAMYADHARALLGYAARRCDEPSDVADVVADTMLVAWRRIDDVPPEPETRLWLFGVARNVINKLEISAGEQMLLEEIMATTASPATSRPSPRRPRPSRHRLLDRPRLVAVLAVGGLVVAGGTAYAAVRALTTEKTASIDVWNQLSANNPAGACSLDPSDGQPVASTRYQGRTIEYWTFDSAAVRPAPDPWPIPSCRGPTTCSPSTAEAAPSPSSVRHHQEAPKRRSGSTTGPSRPRSNRTATSSWSGSPHPARRHPHLRGRPLT